MTYHELSEQQRVMLTRERVLELEGQHYRNALRRAECVDITEHERLVAEQHELERRIGVHLAPPDEAGPDDNGKLSPDRPADTTPVASP